jgi:hypothetical protein
MSCSAASPSSRFSDGGTGTSEAFGYTAGQSGTATSISVYLTRLALYADASGKPGALLDRATLSSNASGWVTAPLAGGVQVIQGTRYWLVIAAYSSYRTVTYRDAGNSGSSLDYSGYGVRNPYSIAAQWHSNPASVYLSGTTSPPPPPPPADADNDGVPDSTDQCSDTPAGTQVDSTGCPVVNPPPPPPPGDYTLPADRAYDWNPGLNAVGGIPNRTNVYRTLTPSGGDDTATIQAALDGCPTNGVVQLTAGTFHISGQGVAISRSYCTLRGAGPGDGNRTGTGTFLVKGSGTSYPVAIIGPRWGGSGTNINLTVDAVRGTKTATVASTSGLSPGDLVVVDQVTPSYSHWNGAQTSGWFEESDRPVGEVMEIDSISGNAVTFTTDFPLDYTVAKSAHLHELNNAVRYSGIEDVYLTGGEGGDGGGGIHMWNCGYCWVKHVEADYNDEPINIDSGFRDEVRDSYIHDAPGGLNNGSASYGIAVNWYTSQSLFENNIVLRFNKVDVMRSAGGGNVFGYNYVDDGADSGGGWFESNLNSSHMTTPHYELFEGNEAANFDQDDRWGNSAYVTIFRNT